MRFIFAAAAVLAASCASAASAPPYHLVRGVVDFDKGPDGNSIFIDAPEGLILVDTGRHPAHSAKLLAYAKQVGRPIAAIINTHWHLDHNTGNYDIRQVYPDAEVYATTAIEGALVGFLNNNRAQAERNLADPNMPEEAKARIRRGRSVIDNPDRLRATRPVTQSGTMQIAGRTLEVHVAPFAATEADLWFYDPETKVAVVGDLVVDLVPFMDSACADGWVKALDEVEATPFTTLIPGHGAAMTRETFQQWHRAFDNFIECGRSTVDKKDCVAGWQRDAAPFIAEADREIVGQAAEYYIDSRLRSSPEEQQKFCKPLTAAQ